MIASVSAVPNVSSIAVNALSENIGGASSSLSNTVASPVDFMRNMVDSISSSNKYISNTMNSDYSAMDISRVRKVQLELENYNIGAQLFSKVVSGVVKDIDALIKIQ